ncbi:MAG: YdeI/OmpD-associated family protein [Myxococcota bacterium]
MRESCITTWACGCIAASAWEKLSAGKQRSLAYPIAQAKTPPTRLKRVAIAIESLLSGEL